MNHNNKYCYKIEYSDSESSDSESKCNNYHKHKHDKKCHKMRKRSCSYDSDKHKHDKKCHKMRKRSCSSDSYDYDVIFTKNCKNNTTVKYYNLDTNIVVNKGKCKRGPHGPRKHSGSPSPRGLRGWPGWNGQTGEQGPVGPVGPVGAQGSPGGVLSSANYFGLMPPNNANVILPGNDIEFPQDGSMFGYDINRLSLTSFDLVNVGTYQVLFQIPVNEPGQLLLTLNGNELPNTMVGRGTGSTQIVGVQMLTTTLPNSTLTVRNPLVGTPLTLLNGSVPLSANLMITRVN